MQFLDRLKDDCCLRHGDPARAQDDDADREESDAGVSRVIEELAERYGDAPALISDRERLSYRALAERANRYARWALGARTSARARRSAC